LGEFLHLPESPNRRIRGNGRMAACAGSSSTSLPHGSAKQHARPVEQVSCRVLGPFMHVQQAPPPDHPPRMARDILFPVRLPPLDNLHRSKGNNREHAKHRPYPSVKRDIQGELK
jgi:hypothetical protein